MNTKEITASLTAVCFAVVIVVVAIVIEMYIRNEALVKVAQLEHDAIIEELDRLNVTMLTDLRTLLGGDYNPKVGMKMVYAGWDTNGNVVHKVTMGEQEIICERGE